MSSSSDEEDLPDIIDILRDRRESQEDTADENPESDWESISSKEDESLAVGVASLYTYEPHFPGDRPVNSSNQQLEVVEQQEDLPQPPEETSNQIPKPEEFCHCGGFCKQMETKEESICCNDLDNTELMISNASQNGEVIVTYDDNLEITRNNEGKKKITCLVQLTSYKNIITNKELLFAYQHQRSSLFAEPEPDNSNNEELRFSAYCLSTSYIHGKLGRFNRRVLPSCMVSTIRRLYPSQDDNYTGFKEAEEEELHANM